ncbi:hypothetical protein Aduo_005862 [Ancylostoma duodenale]
MVDVAVLVRDSVLASYDIELDVPSPKTETSMGDLDMEATSSTTDHAPLTPAHNSSSSISTCPTKVLP